MLNVHDVRNALIGLNIEDTSMNPASLRCNHGTSEEENILESLVEHYVRATSLRFMWSLQRPHPSQSFVVDAK
jgi:hypothetical protein